MRAVVLAVISVAALSVSACGSDPAEPKSPVEARTPGQAPQQLGCHRYCAQSGGYGGGEEGRQYMRIETKGRVVPVSGGVPIEVTCLLRGPCRGAILVTATAPFVEVGRSDLYVAGGGSTTIAVPISAAARRVLDRRAGRLPVEIIADYGDPMCPPRSLRPCTANGRAVIEAP